MSKEKHHHKKHHEHHKLKDEHKEDVGDEFRSGGGGKGPRTMHSAGFLHGSGRKRGALKVLCIGALHLKAADFGGTSDPYCCVQIIKEIDTWHFATELKHPQTKIPYTAKQIDEFLQKKHDSKYWTRVEEDMEEEEVTVFLEELKGLDKKTVRTGLRDYFKQWGDIAEIKLEKTVALIEYEHRGTSGLQSKDFRVHDVPFEGKDQPAKCPVYRRTVEFDRVQRDGKVLNLSTDYKRRNLNPDWNETLIFENYRPGPHRYALIKVFDKDLGSADDLIGECKIRLPRTWGQVRKYVEMIEDTEGRPSGAVVIEFLLSKTLVKKNKDE